MMNWLKEFVNKAWKNIEDQSAKYLAYTVITIFLVLILSLRNWSVSKHTVELYGWVWLSIPLFVVFVALIIYSLSQNKLNNYRRDEIYEMIWKWNDYPESTSDEYLGLTPLCPKCFHELRYTIVQSAPTFICANCSFSTETIIDDVNGRIVYNYDQIIKRVYKETERRIESGDYRKAKKRIKMLRDKFKNRA